MKGIKKYVLAICVLAISGVLLAGCSGQGSSAASSAAAEQTPEDLIAELTAISEDDNYESVTMEIEGDVSIDMAAMLGSISESESDSSASAESDSSNAMDIPIEMLVKADKSTTPAKMYADMSMMGQDFELYVTGEQAVIVMYGEAIGGTLEELGMTQYGSIDEIMQSQGGDFSQYKDAVESISKEKVGDETVYTVVIDPSKISDTEAMSSLASLGSSIELGNMEVKYIVGADGKMSNSTLNMTGTGFSCVMDLKFSDYNATEVPDAPEATMSYSDLMNSTGESLAEAA